jgi:hypothetical protein
MLRGQECGVAMKNFMQIQLGLGPDIWHDWSDPSSYTESASKPLIVEKRQDNKEEMRE